MTSTRHCGTVTSWSTATIDAETMPPSVRDAATQASIWSAEAPRCRLGGAVRGHDAIILNPLPWLFAETFAFITNPFRITAVLNGQRGTGAKCK
jgi:hypothetical protein